ncbi:hypothetical protein WJ63_01555 [Burkholderia pyrrocinia]|nr:hypothetical protein WJ63_01555 [Burkholderia pyrrocinia]
MLLEAPPDRCITVRGRRARLFEREPYISFVTANALVIKQWLLFDPLPEGDARNLLADLRARLPVVAMNMGANFRIPGGDPDVASTAAYDGAVPVLIPVHLSPVPAWNDPAGSCSWSAQDMLERTLEDSPPVNDDRVLAALELFITSQYDFLQRSQFLAQLTILDALATRAKRSGAAAEWIDQKLVEAEAEGFDDPGLLSALGGLKDESHGAAIRTLVRRAVVSLGGSEAEARRQARAVGKLYKVRSRLSHKGSVVELDLGHATQLTRLVLNASARNPSILEVETGEDASLQSGLQQRQRWIAEADAAIRRVHPDCSAVVEAMRRPLILNQLGPLTARLEDGSEWLIGPETARQLSGR